MSKELVSVIIPSFKMGQFIGEALDSVGAQTYPHWEVIVVDDAGPEDGTKAAVQASADRHRNHRIHYTKNKKNRGVSAARNKAVSLAKGSVLAFLDPDDYWSPEHLGEGMAILRQRKEVDVWCSPVEVFGQNLGRRVVWHFSKWRVATFPASLAGNNFIQPSGVLLRRECFDRAGGFTLEPSLQHIEDHDLWIRLVQLGAQYEFGKEPTCHYRLHSGSAMAKKGLLAKLRLAIVKQHPEFFLAMHASLLENAFVNIEQHRDPVYFLRQARIRFGKFRKKVVQKIKENLLVKNRKK